MWSWGKRFTCNFSFFVFLSKVEEMNKNNLGLKINVFFSGALQKFVMDANGKEEESKPKHEEAGAKEEEGNETG